MGPLAGVKVIEMVGIGPGPLCAMLLADLGAEVIRVDRPGGDQRIARSAALLGRNRKSIIVDLKKPGGVETVLRLLERADALLEGFRPGVMERLGLGPDTCLKRNSRLIYGRMTGWGQDGPLALSPGHDINYIALSGALHAIGEKGGRPIAPLNLLGDFAGGAMFLALGIVCALLEARQTGLGQVIDCSMVEGTAVLTTLFFAMQQAGLWKDERGTNGLDGGSHFYNTYETQDGKWIAIGAMEPQFYATLIEKIGADPQLLALQNQPDKWPALKAELARIFRSRTREQWQEILEGSDACFSPILSLAEAPLHAHNRARGSFIEVDGMVQPAPAPRFSRTPQEVRHGSRLPGADTVAVLQAWDFGNDEILNLESTGAVVARR